MILEDGTHYEGEFKGAGFLNGKGTLTLPSGHVLEGNLTGCWNEDIKISNAILKVDSKKNDFKFREFCTPLNQKWKALFKQCHQILGVPDTVKGEVKSSDTHKIWQNVAVYLSNASTAKRKNENKFHNSLNRLDIIPPFGRETLDFKTYQDVKNYLMKVIYMLFGLDSI